MLAAFFIVLSFVSVRVVNDKLLDMERAHRVYRWAEINAANSLLSHELQIERGLSSGYIASRGGFFADELNRQHTSTDSVLERAATVLLNDENLRYFLQARHAHALEDLQSIAELRRRVSTLVLSRDAAVDHYSAMIDMLFDVMGSTLVTDGGTMRPQIAFLAFLQAKEMAGQERALLTAILSSRDFGSFSRTAAFHRIRAIEDQSISRFLLFADEDAKAAYQAIQAQPFVSQGESIRRRVVAAGHSLEASPDVLPSAESWFRVSSQKIDAMKDIEHVLSRSVKQQAGELKEQAGIGLTISSLSALASFLLGGLLLFRMRQGEEMAEKDLHLAATVFSNSVEAIVITDAQSIIVDVNRSFTRITGYERSEVLGRHARMLKSEKNSGTLYSGMWEKLLGAGSWEGEVSNQRKNGEVYPALLSIVAAQDVRGETTNYIAMIVDISKRKKAEGQLERLRTFDPLTGLLSRAAWAAEMDRAVANVVTPRQKFALLEIGLDRFKLINDALGHPVGDKVLTEAANRIRKVLRRQDAAARLGGDRFSILLENIDSRHSVDTICTKLQAAFAAPITVDDHQLNVSTSIGVAIYPDDGGDTATLQRNAEAAMYFTKEVNRGGHGFYAADMNADDTNRLTLERMLRLAMERDELSLHYQPQVDARSGRLVGVEALLRWNSAELGAVSPVRFIPVAEETGLILPIGAWVMQQACLDARRWLEVLPRELPVGVNLSAKQFRSQELLASVRGVLDETGLPGHLLELEITEGLLIVDPSGATVVLAGLRAMGIRVALDDFGTGYSSLAYLKTFPIDRIKIDRAFVRDLPNDRNDQAISRAVVALGKTLNMEVLAEGIETAAQGEFLAAAGCQVFQGNFYGRPMSAEQLMEAIRCGVLTLD